MDILFSSALLLLILFLITQFFNRKHSKILKNLAVFGIFVGVIAIVYVSFFMETMKLVSPLEINTINTTATNLKVYAISFDSDPNDTIHREVVYDKEVAPSSTSNFSIDNDGLERLWIVAKNGQNEIKFLKELKRNNEKINLKITDNDFIDQKNAQTARELIFAFDINKQILNFIIWSNIILMLLLSWSIFKLKKNRIEPQITE